MCFSNVTMLRLETRGIIPGKNFNLFFLTWLPDLKHPFISAWWIGWSCSFDWFQWWLSWKQYPDYLVSCTKFIAGQILFLNLKLWYVFSANRIILYFLRNLRNSQTWIKFYKIWQRKFPMFLKKIELPIACVW